MSAKGLKIYTKSELENWRINIEKTAKRIEPSNCFNEQKHLVDGSPENIYWHYGYLIAQQDTLRDLMKDEK